MRGFLDIFFKIVSVLGHPILLPTYFALTINSMYGLSPVMVLGQTLGFPLLVMLAWFSISQYRRKRQVVDNNNLLNQEDITEMSEGFFESLETFFDSSRNRTFALLIVITFSILGYFEFRLPMWSLTMILTAMASLFCMLINNFWRISIHSYGWGFALYLLLFQYSYVFTNGFVVSVLAICAGGLVLSSRLYLGRHNNLQVHLGFFIGFAIPALFYLALAL